MENNSNEVVEIDLKDLMFAVLHKWRPVLAVAVIMAVLLGGAKGAMTYRKQNDPETAKEARVTYQNDLELYEKNKSTYERDGKSPHRYCEPAGISGSFDLDQHEPV